ncbi:MAG: DNA-invertase [Meiothermus sp.]|nr:MAG: DNA-invertase [Meiothermus sp.]
MKYGYARVSTPDQNLESQIHQLRRAGAQQIFSESLSSRRWDRPQWLSLLAALKPGDSLIVWRLDRAVASVEQLERLVRLLEERKVTLHSLTEKLDTSTAMGRAMVQMIGVLNQLRLDVMRENTQNGLEGARARGVILGRRPILTPDLQAEALELIGQGRSQTDVARIMRVSKSTISRIVRRAKAQDHT